MINITTTPFTLSGRWSHRIRSLSPFFWAACHVSIRRRWRGPLLPNWDWIFEVITCFLDMQMSTVYDMPNVVDGRAYLNSLIFNSVAVSEV
jgi:hypothetical protein